jgi:hypothetical protein
VGNRSSSEARQGGQWRLTRRTAKTTAAALRRSPTTIKMVGMCEVTPLLLLLLLLVLAAAAV